MVTFGPTTRKFRKIGKIPPYADPLVPKMCPNGCIFTHRRVPDAGLPRGEHVLCPFGCISRSGEGEEVASVRFLPYK